VESLIKTIFFILGGIVVLGLIILFLPILIIFYILMPKRSTQSWFNTFSQQARNRRPQQGKTKDSDSNHNNEIPASEDIIDVSADEIKN